MILMKLGEEYKLYSHDSCVATTQESPHKRLSKQNCDEIFGITDVEELSKIAFPCDYNCQGDELDYFERMAWIKGFNKAMELNKDKLFGVKEVVELCKILLSNPIEKCGKTYQELTDNYIQSLQQPTEIEVEIEMRPASLIYKTDDVMPKVDKNGCLILKKK